MKKILFVTSEAHPFIKTGGLADVSGSLPKALAELGQDIKIIMPYYQAIKTFSKVYVRCSLRIDNRDINILETHMPGSLIAVWLVDCPEFFQQAGNPYVDELGNPWRNNAERFALLCQIAVEVAMNRAQLDWQADIVHCNDWQTGLVPALLSLEDKRPACIFTIHNLAYQGLFPSSVLTSLNLPGQLWQPEGLEFHSMLSFIKGGLVYADRITTVSPSYAQEIQSAEFGYGLEGLLSHRNERLLGIINGIDVNEWNPETDSYLHKHYNSNTLNQKQENKTALQNQLSLPINNNIPLIGLISRLVEQKGIDLILDCLPELLTMPVQVVLLGSGDKVYEQKLHSLMDLHPGKMSITLGYNEALAHLIEAGADIFLMPSRFEPCGLNQMYSQRYGTIPIVRKTGGLADTVIDSIPETIANNTATGVVFNAANASALMEAIKRTLILYDMCDIWEDMQKNAMSADFSWQQSAKQYLALYNTILPLKRH